ncbi:anti-sigma factor [Chitinophaga solisilvae]|uniref:Anti-sigma factor n=1 Tax=Chitinophaga solisilvae TaxID=1233460 RepID=A0A3S1AXG8_9BACT|nr:anti-sigma factor [Chitinophaga solisilvae]NSL90498.1 anti-sigma factor [Chitinophaga solisilvae]
MDAQYFISSGLIELYAAGMASEQEVQELEAAMRQFPEVAAAVETYRRNMEEYVSLQRLTPEAAVKTSLFNQINNEPDLQDSLQKTDQQMQQPKLVSMTETKSLSWKWIAAASAALLIGSLILNYVFFNRYKEFKEYKDKYQSLLLSQNSILSKENLYKTRLEQMQQSLDVIQDPDVMKVKMPGTKAFPEAMATVFWNQSSKQVYVKVNKLPEPAADKQYQLWAIVDGKPVSMGVFEMGDTAQLLQKMQITGAAQMFAVTLEKKGGAAAPTMEQMYVAGKVPG